MVNIAIEALNELKLKQGHYIYVVWKEFDIAYPNRSICVYVGRTKNGVKQRLKQHMTGPYSNLGIWLLREMSKRSYSVSVSVYRPDECMLAIEYLYGCGYNPEFVGSVWAEKAMIAMLNPMMNIQDRIPELIRR